MIASGEKKEEYRETKEYWFKRLTEDTYPITYKNYDFIKFTNGYSKNAASILVEFVNTEIGKAVPKWSDNWQGDVFVIKLGDIISPL